MNKKELRKIFLRKRNALTLLQSNRLDDLLLIRFQQWPLPPLQTIMSYWPATERREVNTHLMVEYLSFRIPGLRVAFPVTDMNDHSMKACAVEEDTVFKPNKFGIAEPMECISLDPVELDIVFVPLLAFDKKGYRVGYGKGFYDRYLHHCRNDVLRIGFSHFDPVESIEDINDFDVPLNICITTNKTYEF